MEFALMGGRPPYPYNVSAMNTGSEIMAPKGIALLLGVNFLRSAGVRPGAWISGQAFAGRRRAQPYEDGPGEVLTMKEKTRKITAAGMLCALAYAAAAIGRVPLVLFLKYDPKDVVIAAGGLIFGPLTALSIAVIVSIAEMITISETGILGFFMNVVSSCSFACTAAWVYQKKRCLSGVVTGLLCGWGCMVLLMLFWNSLIAPMYMDSTREEVMKLLLPVFLPFNLIKGGLNAAMTAVFYRPMGIALRRARLM